MVLAVWSGPAASQPPEVEIVRPARAELNRQFSLTGSLTTPLHARLAPALPGLVAAVAVDAGDQVKAGASLLELDAALARHALTQAEAAVRAARIRRDEARRLRDEAKPLADSGSLSQSAWQSRQADLELAEAELIRLAAEQAQQAERLAQHTVKAPFAGVISQRLTAPGEWVDGGTPVLELVGLDPLRIDVQVPQRAFAAIRTGMPVEVRIDAFPERLFSGEVQARVPVADPRARSFLVRVGLANPDGELTPGMSARVSFPQAEPASALSVPSAALQRFPDGSSIVWVVDEQKGVTRATRRPVTLGAERGDRVIVTAGLAADAQVVIRGQASLKEGQEVIARRARR